MDVHILQMARLPRSHETTFRLEARGEELREMADRLGALSLRKVRLEGKLSPVGRRDWVLNAQLGATVEQACVISLEPVKTRIDTEITRQFLETPPLPSGDEDEMPEDDTIEALVTELDLMALLEEAISLEMPDYPRAKDAQLEQTVFAAPGVRPMTDDDAKPLAGLSELRDRLASARPDKKNSD